MRNELARDIERGSNPNRPILALLRRLRGWVEKHPRVRFAYRLFVGVLGGATIILGLLLVPLPGPGWLIVFVGFAILGTEFPAARRIANALKKLLMKFWAWMQRRKAQRAAKRAQVV